MAQWMIALVLVALSSSMAFPRDDQLLRQLFADYLQSQNMIQVRNVYRCMCLATPRASVGAGADKCLLAFLYILLYCCHTETV